MNQDDPYVPPETIAGLLNITPRRVHQLAKEGVIPAPDAGAYHIWGSIQGYVKFLQQRRGNQQADSQQEATRLTKAKADLAELDREQRIGELLKASVVRAQDARLATILRNNLQSIPDRLALILAAESDERTVYNAMSTEIRSSLEAVIAAMQAAEVDDAQLDITRRAALAALDDEDE